jgi:hypothetical protein
MSYSRWGNSCWYTFYCDSSTSSKKEDQVMACFHIIDDNGCIDWRYNEILELLTAGTPPAWSPNKKIRARYNCTIIEADELIGYMKKFLADVDSEIYL